jgi:hypothetical protein
MFGPSGQTRWRPSAAGLSLEELPGAASGQTRLCSEYKILSGLFLSNLWPVRNAALLRLEMEWEIDFAPKISNQKATELRRAPGPPTDGNGMLGDSWLTQARLILSQPNESTRGPGPTSGAFVAAISSARKTLSGAVEHGLMGSSPPKFWWRERARRKNCPSFALKNKIVVTFS